MNKKNASAVIILIGLMVFSWWLWDSKPSRKASVSPADNEAITIDRNLSSEDIKIYQDRLNEANLLWQQVSANPEATSKDKYNVKMQIAVQLDGLGRLSEARDAYKEAADIKPSEVPVYISLASLYVEMKDYAQAQSKLEKAISLAPEKPDYWRRLISLRQEFFNADKTELDNLYNQALEKTKNNVDILTAYAVFLEQQGDLQGAIDYWTKAMAAKPENKSIYQAEINRIKQR